MSITIIKKGLSDRIVDQGRFGFQDIGIQPSGPMDFLSAQLANVILGNEVYHPVFELHFPASVFEFQEPMYICISGANFVPVINEKSIALIELSNSRDSCAAAPLALTCAGDV